MYADRAEIEILQSRTDDAASWLDRVKDDPAASDRAGHALKRMPRLPGAAKGEYELSKIFQVKKFLANYSALRNVLDGDIRAAFGLEPAAEPLMAELSKGGADPESFHLANAFDPALAEVREEISRTYASLEAVRLAAEARLASRPDPSGGKGFCPGAADLAQSLLDSRDLANVEPYDEKFYLVRLRRTRIPWSCVAGGTSSPSGNGIWKSVCWPGFGHDLGRASRNTEAARRAKDFDLALARARLVRRYSLVRPDLDSESWELDSGRFLPCQRECESLGLSYTPLSARFGRPVTTIFGSNMGGKTIALKTVLFFQMLAQAGFHVPATSFRTRVFPRLSYVGELTGERLAGLSGFGFEIHRFLQAWEGMGAGGLVVFDEFARTTSSREAEALLSAAQAALAARPDVKSFFATHFRGLERSDGVSYLRMKGLDKRAASEFLASDAPLAERLGRINRHMRYELEPDEDGPGAADALTVAALLGLPEEIVKKAGDVLDRRASARSSHA